MEERYNYTIECPKCKWVKPYHPLVIDGVMINQEFQCTHCLSTLMRGAADKKPSETNPK